MWQIYLVYFSLAIPNYLIHHNMLYGVELQSGFNTSVLWAYFI